MRTKPDANPTLALRRRGTAATEFALVLPLVLVVAFGCLDLGRAIQHYSVMSNAASAGAQRGATTRFYAPYTSAAWEAKVRDTVREELTSLTAVGTPMAAFNIQINTDNPQPGDAPNPSQSLPRITVAVDYSFRTTFRWPGLPRLIPLRCESVIRQYR